MTADYIQMRLLPDSQDRFDYRICNQILCSNRPVDALKAFEIVRPADADAPVYNAPVIDNSPGQLLFQDTSWLAGKMRPLSCRRTESGYRVQVEQLVLHVHAQPAAITQLDESIGSPDPAVLEEILLGPPLMLTLALRHLFALHASAVMLNDQALLFMGDSGHGKSTLARWLDQQTPFRRLTDDISVIEQGSPHYRLQPGFAQLKLPQTAQPAGVTPVNLAGIVLLNRKQDAAIELTRLDGLAAIQALVNHSVATQLFDKPLAQQHLAFMANLSQNLPIHDLSYPNGQIHIGAIAEILANQLD